MGKGGNPDTSLYEYPRSRRFKGAQVMYDVYISAIFNTEHHFTMLQAAADRGHQQLRMSHAIGSSR